MRRFNISLGTIVPAAAILALTAVMLLLLSTQMWDGYFTVPLILLQDGTPIDPRQVKSVTYEAHHKGYERFGPLTEMDRAALDMLLDAKSWDAEALFRNDRWELSLQISGKSNAFTGTSHDVVQPDMLVIRVTLVTGESVVTVCPVRDREQRQAVVIDMGTAATQPGPQPAQPARGAPG